MICMRTEVLCFLRKCLGGILLDIHESPSPVLPSWLVSWVSRRVVGCYEKKAVQLQCLMMHLKHHDTPLPMQ
jgi:hypothetical protein